MLVGGDAWKREKVSNASPNNLHKMDGPVSTLPQRSPLKELKGRAATESWKITLGTLYTLTRILYFSKETNVPDVAIFGTKYSYSYSYSHAHTRILYFSKETNVPVVAIEEYPKFGKIKYTLIIFISVKMAKTHGSSHIIISLATVLHIIERLQKKTMPGKTGEKGGSWSFSGPARRLDKKRFYFSRTHPNNRIIEPTHFTPFPQEKSPSYNRIIY